MNVVRLDRLLRLSACPDASRLFLILPRNLSTPLGILACEIIDTPKLELKIESRAYQAEGVLGTMMIRGEIALFIDLDQIVRMWEKTPGLAAKSLPARPAARILVVDDTHFFQKLVAEHLRQVGYEVHVADDGKAGFAMLREQPFDLVVSDIEMPVMDGHAFARAVRADPTHARLPLVALTTLNTPASRAAATESGFDAYEVKLDRQTLLETVGSLLARARGQASSAGTEQHA
jgi:two-component system chemotaxis sensor kinase CheA